MPSSTASAGVVKRHLAPGDFEAAGGVGREAGERTHQLLAPRADDAGYSEDLARMELEADVPVGLARREPVGLQHHLVLKWPLQGLKVIVRLQRPPDHQTMQGRDVGVRGREFTDDLAVLHHVDAIRDLQNLVEPVGDEDERGARFQRAHPAEQDVDLRTFEDGSRFVEQNDEMAGGVLVERQRLRKLHHLPPGEAQFVRARARDRPRA